MRVSTIFAETSNCVKFFFCWYSGLFFSIHFSFRTMSGAAVETVGEETAATTTATVMRVIRHDGGGDADTQRVPPEDLQLSVLRNSRNKLTLQCKLREDLASRSPGILRFEAEVHYAGSDRQFMLKKKAKESCYFALKVRHGYAYYFVCCVYNGNNVIAEKSPLYNTCAHMFHVPSASILKLRSVKELMNRAIKLVTDQNIPAVQADVLYRNNPWQYFDNIFKNNGGVMKVGPKNANGDARSPINDGRIMGIDFNCGRGSRLIRSSPFGDTMFVMAISKLIDPHSDNLYFADLYCHNPRQNHRVALVVTKPGSEMDEYCGNHLVKIPLIPTPNTQENPFFFYQEVNRQFYRAFPLWIDLCYTEDVDLGAEVRNNERSMKCGFGRRIVGYGKLKNPQCSTCNLPGAPPPCKRKNCKFCSKINQGSIVSSSTQNIHTCPVLEVTCESHNLVYLLQCNLCGVQYVGQTSKTLAERVGRHFRDIKDSKNTSLAQHVLNNHPEFFNNSNNNDDDDSDGLLDITISVLELVPADLGIEEGNRYRMGKEKEWIQRLDTIQPKGLNKRN